MATNYGFGRGKQDSSWYNDYAASTSKPYSGQSTGTYRGVAKPTTTKTPQQKQQPQVANFGGSGGGGGGGYKSSFNWQDWMPSLPQQPQVTQQLIAEWLERAKNEAGLQFDPQILAIQQELDKAKLTAEQSKGALPQYYQDIMDYINQWQTDETSAEQRRAYSRGFGRSGDLSVMENKIAEQALKQGTSAQTEKARKLSDIDAQVQQLQEQAGAKIEGAETARGQYVAARRSELEDSYVANQQALAQQQFANQMAIQQFGLTAETQAFGQWLSQMEMANEINYQNQIMTLQQEAEQRAAQFTSGNQGIKTTGTGGVTIGGSGAQGQAYNMPSTSSGKTTSTMFGKTNAWSPTEFKLLQNATASPSTYSTPDLRTVWDMVVNPDRY